MENEFLYRSLTQDLRSLNNLTRTMLTNKALEAYSWLDPRKTFSELDDISSFYVSDENGRVKCLELIVDRLYMILNLNVEYLEMPFKMKTKLQRNVEKPKNLTLGLSANLLWDKIQQFILDADLCKVQPTLKTKPAIASSKRMFDDKQVQTSTRFEACLACKISQDCIKTIAKELLQQKQDQHVMEAKKRIQSSIFDVTQLDSMNLLCNAIKNDISHLVKQNRDIEGNMEEQARMYEYLNYNYQDILKRNESLLVKIQELEELEQGHLETVGQLQGKNTQLHFEKYEMEGTVDMMKKQFDDIQDEHSKCCETITNLQSQIKSLQKKIDSLTDDVQTTASEKELWKIRFTDAHTETKKLRSLNEESKLTVDKLEKKLKDVITRVDELNDELKKACEGNEETMKTREAETNLWKMRYNDMATENQTLKSLNDELKDVIGKLENEMDLVASHFSELDKKIQRNYEEIDNNAKAYVDLLKRTQEVVESSDTLTDLKEHCSSMNNTTDEFEVKGDPVYDMMKQVEINNLNMQKLEKQNSMLIKTIRKFKYRNQKDINIK